MTQHAILSASGASRWLACPPSARLEQNFPNTTSEYAEEGTLAHELGEQVLKQKLGLISIKEFNKEYKTIKENKFYAPDMLDYVDTYIDTCMEKVSEAKARTPDAIFRIEQKLVS